MNRKQTRIDNLVLLAAEAGSAAELARITGVSEAYISQIITGVKLPSGKPRGVGDKMAATLEAGMHKHEGWMDCLHVQEGACGYDTGISVTDGPETHGRVPLISWVRAGTWHEAADTLQPADAEVWLPCPVRHSRYTYALRVQGDSMTSAAGRSYPENCIIYVDPEIRACVPGERVKA